MSYVAGVPATIARIARIPEQVGGSSAVAMGQIVLGGQGIARGNASGRPGPRVITGSFRRSIVGQVISSGGGVVEGEIGSSAPQAARLEFPFYGPDSLGRTFPGTTYPWLTPSVEPIRALAETVVTRVVGGAA